MRANPREPSRRFVGGSRTCNHVQPFGTTCTGADTAAGTRCSHIQPFGTTFTSGEVQYSVAKLLGAVTSSPPEPHAPDLPEVLNDRAQECSHIQPFGTTCTPRRHTLDFAKSFVQSHPASEPHALGLKSSQFQSNECAITSSRSEPLARPSSTATDSGAAGAITSSPPEPHAPPWLALLSAGMPRAVTSSPPEPHALGGAWLLDWLR